MSPIVYVFKPLSDNVHAIEVGRKFRSYKANLPTGYTFGKDGPYIRPEIVVDAGLQHVHIILKNNLDKKNLNQERRRSDLHLVYCQGRLNPNNFLLLAFINDAHKRANDYQYMQNLAASANEFYALEAADALETSEEVTVINA